MTHGNDTLNTKIGSNNKNKKAYDDESGKYRRKCENPNHRHYFEREENSENGKP